MNLKPLEKICLSLIVFAIVITILILAKTILIPLFISILFAYLLYPLVWKIEKQGVHRGLSIAIVMVIALLIISGIILFVSIKASNFSLNIAEVKDHISARTNIIMDSLEDTIGLNKGTIEANLDKMLINISSSWQDKISGVFSKTTTIIFQIGIMPVFIFFLLYYRTKTAYFIFRLVGNKNRGTALVALRDIANVATKYLFGQLIVILVLSILNTVGLLIIGVPNSLFFGVLVAVLNVIPYLGLFIGNIVTIVYVLFTVPNSSSMALQVFVVYSAIQFLENNLITPNIVGNNIKINPFAIILGVLLANLVWGIAGMLIIIPFLAIFRIIMSHIEDLKPFAYLISDSVNENSKVKFKWWNSLITKINIVEKIKKI